MDSAWVKSTLCTNGVLISLEYFLDIIVEFCYFSGRRGVCFKLQTLKGVR